MSKAVDIGQTSHADDLAKPPEWYLEHATQCTERAQLMTSGSNSIKVKLNLSQCAYLARVLKTAVEDSRESYVRSSSSEHKAECLETLKLLYRLAKEVESFIQDCCGDISWIQTASTWASVPVHVSSLGCYLKLCTRLLRNSNKLGAAWLEFLEIQGLQEVELLAVREKAFNDDQGTLFSLLWSESQSEDLAQLATILSKRLRANQVMSTAGSIQSLKLWKEDGGRLRRSKNLSKGSSTTVHEAKWFGALDVAERVFPVPSEKFHLGFEKEVSVLAQLSHPNIVTFLGYRAEKHSCSALMELMDGDLKVLMQQKMQEDSTRDGPFSIWEACDIMLQVAEGVHYIHEKGVVHGNLKSSSILFKRSKDPNIEYVSAKLANFGLSKYKEDMILAGSSDFAEKTYRDPMQASAGLLKYWMAPELIALDEDGGLVGTSDKSLLKCSKKSDAFSFGMFCFEILTGNMPFSKRTKKIMKMIKLDGVRPELPGHCPQDMKVLIKLCWDSQPDTRPSFDKICEELQYIRCSLLTGGLATLPMTEKCCNKLNATLFCCWKCRKAPCIWQWEVSKFKEEYSSLKVVRQLGKGGSDSVTVYVATWRRPEGVEEDAAQKTFIGSNDDCFVNEVSIMAALKHPNVVRLLCYATDRRFCSIVMERMDADLHDLMRQRRLERNATTTGPFSIAEAVSIMLQIAEGMEYVHSKYVVHRDLKSCNILVSVSESGQLDAKVADFGLSVRMDSRSSRFEASAVGTVRWMAPEILSLKEDIEDTHADTSNYDPFMSDVYSFGMVCYEILAGRVPFFSMGNLNQVKLEVLDGERPSLPEWTPIYLKTLVQKCWQKEVSSRPLFSEIVEELQAAVALAPRN